MNCWQQPSFPHAILTQVTNTLARWLPSSQDASVLSGWDEITWRAAACVAYWQSAIPWLVERVRQTTAPVPRHVWHHLVTINADSRERTRRMLANMEELLVALQARGIDAIPLKGAVLAPFYYRDPLRRPMGDLDILVHRRDMAAAREVMQRLGYRFFLRAAHHEVYVRGERKSNMWAPDNVHPVDVHFTLSQEQEFAGLTHDLTQVMWELSVRQPYRGGIQALIPPPSALLYHVSAHSTADLLTRHGKLMHLDDIRHLVARMAPEEWTRFLVLITPYNARFVYPALALTARYADIVIPDRVLLVLHGLSPPRLRAWVKEIELADLSEFNLAPSGVIAALWRLLARSRWEQACMLLRLAFPRRWSMIKRYPRLIPTPFWPLAYVLLNGERMWHALWEGRSHGPDHRHP